MTKKMAICNIQYTFERYAGIDVEKIAWGIHDYAKRAFAEFHPMVSEPGNGVEMPDYVDVTLCKKDGSFFIEADIRRRAANIPRECQTGGLIVSISIKNSDGTSFRFKHEYPHGWTDTEKKPNAMRQLKIKKTILPLFLCHLVVGESDCALAVREPKDRNVAKAKRVKL